MHLIKHFILACGLVGFFSASMPVSASIITTVGGWSISMPSWALPEGGAIIVRDTGPGISDNILMLEIAKVFKGSPDIFGGLPSILITFTQVAPDEETISKIVINDESITNSTTVAWHGFSMILVSPGQATFNRPQTFPGDFGGDPSQNLAHEPFATHQWFGPSSGTEELFFSGGIVGINGDFNPGSSAGSVVIDVDLSGSDPVVWKIKEIARVPDPATLAFLVIGSIAVLRRRAA